MKETAKVLKFEGMELRTADECKAVLNAVMSDVIAGDITRAEADRITKEVNAVIERVASGARMQILINKSKKGERTYEHAKD